MAYLKPTLFTRRLFNPLAMRFGINGAVALAVAGRRTGRTRVVAVIPVEHEGARYLVSPRGEADWVRNLRAAGQGELRAKGAAERFRATEVPAPARAPILATYQRAAGRAVAGNFAALPDPADHPVFRIEPRES
jgi:deazaflavin-dependent oxidoreductase (nitroreductase family)